MCDLAILIQYVIIFLAGRILNNSWLFYRDIL